ncbi:uncharacterized protein LOC131635721 [Vicia villosa]|uniref:uncharacterized protein LOC131635721 n=1 Tax=Vicia villosa TaxID=3911 RepID=UPI00273B75D7|nr:uncharacterized protein LOC131635721 [Vicia villosa]
MLTAGKFSMQRMYDSLIEDSNIVLWFNLMMHNLARPNARITLWLLYHGHLPTKDRLVWFGVIGNAVCSMCGIWQGVLNWLNVNHTPQPWSLDLIWILAKTKEKGRRARILKMAVTKTIHEVWLYRNAIVFNYDTYRNNTLERIIDSIVYKGWRNRKIRLHLANLMV